MGSNPTGAFMQLVSYTGRPKPLFWVELQMATAVLSGRPITIVASCHEQAERTFEAAKSLVNGRDPKAQPG